MIAMNMMDFQERFSENLISTFTFTLAKILWQIRRKNGLSVQVKQSNEI